MRLVWASSADFPGKDTLGVAGESQFVFQTLGNLFVGQTHALEDRVRDLQGQSDGFILAYFQLPELLSPIGKPLALRPLV